MTVQREFLGWDRPILHTTVEFLEDLYLAEGLFDLSTVVIALPGGRASRRLLELLVTRSKELRLPLLPPTIITTGQIPEFFVPSFTSPFTSSSAFSSAPIVKDIGRAFLFASVLQSYDPNTLAPLFPNPQKRKDYLYWHELGLYLDRIYVELKGARLTFTTLQSLIDLPSLLERWRIIEELFTLYEKKLSELGLTDRHLAREVALTEEKVSFTKHLYLVSNVDLNNITKEFLGRNELKDKLKDELKIVSLIAAPESKAGDFDQFGCIIKEGWLTEELLIDNKCITLCASSAEEGEAVLERINSLKNISAYDLSIGLGNESLAPYIVESLISKGVKTRSAVGLPVSKTPILKLFSGINKFLNTLEYTDFASLLRHEEFSCWLTKDLVPTLPTPITYSTLISISDLYQNKYLQAKTESKLFGDDDDEDATVINSAFQKFTLLIAPLKTQNRSIEETKEAIYEIITQIFGAKELFRGDKQDLATIQTCELIENKFVDLEECLLFSKQPLSGSEVLSILLAQIVNENLTPESEPDAIELLGWLELVTDDAPNLIITGFNEGYVPQSMNEDPLLPDGLRKRAGLLCNDQRYGRDVYALSTMLNNRASLSLVLSSNDPSGIMLSPSRLLLTCKEEDLPQRILNLLDHGKRYRHNQLSKDRNLIDVLIPNIKSEIASLKVTSFKDYIHCPFRFYLQHILKLRSVDDFQYELDPLIFGTLAHSVLSDFAKSEFVESKNKNEISKYLLNLLDAYFKRSFGDNAYPALYIQRELLKERLSAFAECQAERRSQGWIIKHSEFAITDFKLPLANGQAISLTGRIDRIDFNKELNRWAVIDYKTSSDAKTPENTHLHKAKGWIDLQLPLYYYFAKSLCMTEEIELGYCNLPSGSEDTDFKFAKWGQEELAEAYALASSIGEKIVDNKFWPPAVIDGGEFDDFRHITKELLKNEARA